MRSSSAALRLTAALLAASTLGAFGCAAPVRRGEAPAPAPATAPVPRASGVQAPSSQGRGPAPGGAGSEGAPGRLDPSEQITPGELASIPDPVPEDPSRGAGASGAPSGPNAGLKGSSPPPMDSVAPAAPETPSGVTGEAVNDLGTDSYWRVQVFASESAAEAERVAGEAESDLGVPADVIHEGPLYKVRLGRFATEGEAQSLRERAVDAGYRGAFRTKAR